MKSVLKEEQTTGLETFYTKGDGIGGKLRTYAEDFIVNELVSPPEKNDDGLFTIATIQSKNWETNHLIRILSNKLHISRNRIRFAGTKDKRSISTQLFSFYDVPIDHIKNLNVKDVNIEGVYRSDKKLFLGALKGNQFDICIREVSDKISKKQIEAVLDPMIKIKGFPNFFGIQRFGIIRPITHIVGKKMVQGDIEGAVMTYLCHIDPYEDEEIKKERIHLAMTNDYAHAFHHFPMTLSYEKAMLNILQVHPDDFHGAIKELPKNLISLFINAYQSYLFNRMLSIRIKKNIPLDQAIDGDVIIEIQRGQPIDNQFPVSEKNIEKVNTQIKRGKAVVSSVLVGYETRFSKGQMGEIEHQVFNAETIDKRDFIIQDLPVATSAGTRRGILAPIEKVSYQVNHDNTKNQVWIQFNLKKGCYATSFLRELMKADNIRNY